MRIETNNIATVEQEQEQGQAASAQEVQGQGSEVSNPYLTPAFLSADAELEAAEAGIHEAAALCRATAHLPPLDSTGIDACKVIVAKCEVFHRAAQAWLAADDEQSKNPAWQRLLEGRAT
jgi:hypothetical protein